MILCYSLYLLVFVCTPAMAGWVEQNSGTMNNLYNVTANHSNNNEAWVCGEGGIILHTSTGGATWTQQNSGTTRTLYDIAFIETDGGPVVVVGAGGTILRTSNSGTTWLSVASGTTANLYGLSDFHIHAVGDSGVMLASTDFGFTWTRVAPVTTRRLVAVSTSFGGTSCGDSGTILRLFAAAWQSTSSGTAGTLRGIPMFASNNIVVGDSGLVLRSTDFGLSWSPQPTGTTKRLNSAEFSANNDDYIYCVGDGGTIIKSTNNGSQWGAQQSGTARNLNSVFFYLSDSFGWAVGDSGTILRTTDGGGPITGMRNSEPRLPATAWLGQNYPNPFNPTTTIEISLPRWDFGTLRIFSILGEEVATLVQENLSAGIHHVVWNAQGLPSGVYFCRLQTSSFTETKKLLLLR
jgi:photosystem II stability/assembly factor-like uncharacterized protein